ncbi:MAG: hypothetical protein ACKPHU_37405, partial [Planctomycetaceae bacterium]
SVPPLLLPPSVVCPRWFPAGFAGFMLSPARPKWCVPAGSVPPVPAGPRRFSRQQVGVVCPCLVPPRGRFEWCVPAVGRFRRLQFPGRELCGAANCGGRMPGGAG